MICPKTESRESISSGLGITSMNHSVVGFYIGAYLANAELLMATIGELIGFVASGQVKIQVGTVLPLSQAAEAHRLLEGRQTTGKVVLEPWRTA